MKIIFRPKVVSDPIYCFFHTVERRDRNKPRQVLNTDFLAFVIGSCDLPETTLLRCIVMEPGVVSLHDIEDISKLHRAGGQVRTFVKVGRNGEQVRMEGDTETEVVPKTEDRGFTEFRLPNSMSLKVGPDTFEVIQADGYTSTPQSIGGWLNAFPETIEKYTLGKKMKVSVQAPPSQAEKRDASDGEERPRKVARTEKSSFCKERHTWIPGDYRIGVR